VDGTVFFDTRKGPIIIGEEVEVEAFSHLTGPCYIGRATKVHSAFIRGGTTIGEACRVGGEIENSIISPYTNKAHYGYVGNSIVGEWVNLGAGSVFSDLKNTYGTIKVELPEGRIDTGMRKLGPMIGDMSKVSIGCRIFAGMRIGVSSHLIDLVTKNVPSFVFYRSEGNMVELDLKSAIETQKRMMERRGVEMSRELEKLIRLIYSTTNAERRKAGARKGKLNA
jgi:UDP-N-acetylglucosamine diphosphorylase/glucosamine-1-phosphate N-acetyltransferase